MHADDVSVAVLDELHLVGPGGNLESIVAARDESSFAEAADWPTPDVDGWLINRSDQTPFACAQCER